MSKNFLQKHKKKIIIGGLVTIGVVGGVYITYKCMEAEDARLAELKASSEATVEKATKAIEATIGNEREQNRRLWEAGNYQENYDKVSAFVKDLKFAPGEQWILEENSISTDQPYTGEGWIAGHLVNNLGIYPPDEID